MKKDRFVAFFDAIMAIIMTIAVLQFAVPAGAKWSDLGDLGFQVLVYAMSFFWLGMLWISIHNMWHKVEYITRGVLVIDIIMLFFTSMIPFFIIYIGMTVCPAAVAVSVFVAGIMLLINFMLIKKKKQ